MSNDPHERESISVIPRIFASIGGFLVCTFGLNIINYFNEMAGDHSVTQTQESGEILNISVTGFTYTAVAIVVLFIVCIGITCAVVKEKPTVGEGKSDTLEYRARRPAWRRPSPSLSRTTSWWLSSACC